LLFVIRRTECDLTVKLKALCTVHLNQTFWDWWTDYCAVPIRANRVYFVNLLKMINCVLLNQNLLVVEAAEI